MCQFVLQKGIFLQKEVQVKRAARRKAYADRERDEVR